MALDVSAERCLQRRDETELLLHVWHSGGPPQYVEDGENGYKLREDNGLNPRIRTFFEGGHHNQGIQAILLNSHDAIFNMDCREGATSRVVAFADAFLFSQVVAFYMNPTENCPDEEGTPCQCFARAIEVVQRNMSADTVYRDRAITEIMIQCIVFGQFSLLQEHASLVSSIHCPASICSPLAGVRSRIDDGCAFFIRQAERYVAEGQPQKLEAMLGALRAVYDPDAAEINFQEMHNRHQFKQWLQMTLEPMIERAGSIAHMHGSITPIPKPK